MTTTLIEAGDLRLCHTVVRFIPGFGERACDVSAIRRHYDEIQVWLDTGLGEESVIFQKNTPVEVAQFN